MVCLHSHKTVQESCSPAKLMLAYIHGTGNLYMSLNLFIFILCMYMIHFSIIESS